MSIELGQVDHREFELSKKEYQEINISAGSIIRLPLEREKQEVTVNPSIEEQVVTPDIGKELSKVTINGVTGDIDANIVSRNIRAGVSILGVDGNLQPDKPDQQKTVTPTKERQEIVADAGYELAKTIIEPIPDNFIEPSGTLDIADNGNYDVAEYANVAVNVGGENKFAKLVSGENVELTASDLKGATSIITYAFYNYGKLASIEIPSTVTSIGNNAFQYCYALSNVEFEENSQLTTFGNSVFSGCIFSKIRIPSSVRSIGNSTFQNLKKLTSVTFEDNSNLTSIGSWSFASCSNLESITIPASVTSLADYAFNGCSKITFVKYNGQAPNILNNTFGGCNSVEVYDFRNCQTMPTLYNTNSLGYKSGCKIVVPDSIYDTAINMNVWSSLPTDTTASKYVVWVKASEYVEE